MKGLFLNNYYSAQDGLKISLLISALLVVLTLFVTDNVAAAAMGLIIFIFPTNNVSSLQADENSKWNKYEITTPVSRFQIILSKYIYYLGTVILGFICSLAVVCIIFITGRKVEVSILLYPILFCIALSLFMGAFLYPLLLKLGALKAELFTVISAILSVGIMFFIWFGVNKLLFVMDFKSIMMGSISCILSLIFFTISFWISYCIYQKKEF